MIFLKKIPANSSGGRISVKWLSKQSFLSLPKHELNRRNIQFCNEDNFSHAISEMELGTFEEEFTNQNILTMQNNGVLDYTPQSKVLNKKYPMFRKDVYTKYGINKGE